MGLKLGIPLIESIQDMSLNRTKVGLKPKTICGHNVPILVWIEPRWDWNLIHGTGLLHRFRFESNQGGIETFALRARSVHAQSLNRTKVGLKLEYKSNNSPIIVEFESNQGGIETLAGTSSDYTKKVWIEPRWDWNTGMATILTNWSGVWIEPRWDWNWWLFLAFKI